MYLFSNAKGSFVFDEQFQVKDKIMFSKEDAIRNSHQLSRGELLLSEKELLEKHAGAKKVDSLKILNKILEHFKKEAREFYDIDLINTKRLVSESVKDDLLIIQAIRTSEDLDKVANGLSKRVREWYALYLPEAEKKIDDNEDFVDTIIKKSKKELISDLKVEITMGHDLKQIDVDTIIDLAKTISALYKKRRDLEDYMNDVMKKICPNFHAITGTNIGAKMIARAGSVEKMMFMPASTIQLLGAEEALFRHIKTGARPPKYGILLQHPLVSKMRRDEKGKAAKAIADKLCIAIKVDYFKGEFIGDRLKADLEKKFSK